MHRHALGRSLVLAILAGVVLAAAPAAAQLEPVTVALEVNARSSMKGDPTTASSVSRRVTRHLVPLLEEMGYEVTRVRRARRAIREGNHALAVRIDVDAAPVYLVHDAHQYDRSVVTDHEVGVDAWGDFQVWSGLTRRMESHGDIGPIHSQLHGVGAGRPVLDDEEATGRLFADLLATALGAELARLR